MAENDIQFALLTREHLPDVKIKTIFEVGTRDCLDAIPMVRSFPGSKVYSFEANPKTIPTAIKNAEDHPEIIVVPMAVCEHDGVTDFFQSKTENDGCSSLLEPSGKYDCIERMPQEKITVPCTRLDTFCQCSKIYSPDAMWLDAQGGEIIILKSLGSRISAVQAIWAEFAYDHMYKDQPLLPDLTAFLEEHGLKFIWKQDVLKDPNTGKVWWGDAFFARI